MLSWFKAKPNAVLVFLYPAAKALCLRQAGSHKKGKKEMRTFYGMLWNQFQIEYFMIYL